MSKRKSKKSQGRVSNKVEVVGSKSEPAKRKKDEFDKLWESRLSDHNGLLTEVELRFLFDLAKSEKPEVIAEIGCLYGLSTITLALASPESKLYTIDNFSVNGPDAREYLQRKVLDQVKNVVLVEGDANVVAESFNKTINLLFVDGNHMDDGIRDDCANWLPKLSSGGVAIFHDYHNQDFPSVKPRVDAAINGWEFLGQAGSAVAFRKP